MPTGWGRLRLVNVCAGARGRPAGRPAGAPPAPGGADQLFRTYPAAAADLPYRDTFGPADEGDAERPRLPVAAVARFLPRAFRRDHVGARAAAAVALHQL